MVEGVGRRARGEGAWSSSSSPSPRHLNLLGDHSARASNLPTTMAAVRRSNPAGEAIATLIPVPQPARWRDLPLPRFDGDSTAGSGGAGDRKGKGKAGEVSEERPVETWREAGACCVVDLVGRGANSSSQTSCSRFRSICTGYPLSPPSPSLPRPRRRPLRPSQARSRSTSTGRPPSWTTTPAN